MDNLILNAMRTGYGRPKPRRKGEASGKMGMTVSEAILILNANAVIACERAGFNSATVKMMEDALDTIEDALKAQEPRVMTLEEAKSAYVVEYRSGKMREVGSALLDLNVDPLNAEYGKIYRVWTSRPTDEQREAIPWMT